MTAQMAKTVKFMFSNGAYRSTVYKTGALDGDPEKGCN